ncbi:response regulator [Thermodesulfovibrio yellowstonii]|uniref:histidine kinase n=1 Tax=Thermodesulfovibrio yellowstonii (strain ATCC 51303 / DSM 11347 / YP87) TaxID=289376 RepID=B5YJ23_THEYD|nr:response regulator [Thermodesulfovibrio yellowstonii]ACI20983.1 chemotaxis protein histidine kinase CheA, putative [Thermodesulfovibrio yellowstonii DSM 11347]
MINKSELIKYFLLEADDCLNVLVEGTEELETKGYNKSTIESLFRATHTLKGSASIVKFNKITTLSHKLEDLFEALLNGEINYDNSLIYHIRNVINLIVALVNEVHEAGEEKSEIEKEVIELIDNILNKKEIPAVQQKSVIFDALPVTDNVRVELKVIENIFASLSEVLVQKNTITDKEKELFHIVEEISNSGKKLLKEITDFSDMYWLSTYERGQKVIDSFFVDFSDLEFDRYDEYHIFLRKIQEITNDITEGINSLFIFSENLSSHFKSLGREINYLKDSLIEIRMIPIGKLLHRLSEAIKENAKDIGKTVEIDIKGAEIKIDKPVFDSLYEPIIHILRNAIQHGIESFEERIKKGKEQTGHIKIDVKKEGKYIVIAIKDDGRGIDIDKVKEIAVQKGLISSEYTSFISEEEILSYIFVPGFSTSDEIDFQSGRGMGLNIVKTAISKLKGTIEVFSELDKETTFIIKIPQSLTISNLLIFSSHNLDFAIPINYIEEILTLEDFPHALEERSINHKNRIIPVKIFSEIFFSLNGKTLQKGYIIVFNFSGIRKGLIVDEILGHEEATVHNFGKFLEGLIQYLGYFISGKGSPRYVIDPLKLFEEEFIFTGLSDKITESFIYSGSVLVVDDSISVRKTLQSVLEAKKLRVYTAKDGVEALNLLERNKVDMVVTDLEMPVMHGYELISRLRKDARFKNLPIIVLTSRGTKKHEEKAFELGADGYIVKPFDEKTIEEEILDRLKLL